MPAQCGIGASHAATAPAAGTHGWDAQAGARASANGNQVPVAAQLERCRGNAGLSSVVPGARWRWRQWGRRGKSSVFNVPDSHLFLKTNRQILLHSP